MVDGGSHPSVHINRCTTVFPSKRMAEMGCAKNDPLMKCWGASRVLIPFFGIRPDRMSLTRTSFRAPRSNQSFLK